MALLGIEKKIKEIMNKPLSAWEKVQIARLVDRPVASDYIEKIFENFMEFHGDRQFADDPSIIGGVALLDGIPVTVIAQQKGKNTKDKIFRNFGCTNPEGYRKALRLMKQAEKFNRPVICFVDTQGAYPGLGAEERGQGEAIAKNLLEMSNLKTPIISIVIGEGGSGGALAMAVADEVWMLEHAVYSILSPEGFATILWKDSSRAKEAADIMKITAQDLKEFGIIDRVISEPVGGAHKDFHKTADNIKKALTKVLPSLASKSKQELVETRYNKYRAMGKFIE